MIFTRFKEDFSRFNLQITKELKRYPQKYGLFYYLFYFKIIKIINKNNN